MNEGDAARDAFSATDALPSRRDLFYGGAWQRAQGGYAETTNPATAKERGACAEAFARRRVGRLCVTTRGAARHHRRRGRDDSERVCRGKRVARSIPLVPSCPSSAHV